jgi:hypothetical protein
MDNADDPKNSQPKEDFPIIIDQEDTIEASLTSSEHKDKQSEK